MSDSTGQPGDANPAAQINVAELNPIETKPGKNGRCYLLELPGELRNLIYEFALVDATPIAVQQWYLPCSCEARRSKFNSRFRYDNKACETTDARTRSCRNREEKSNRPNPEPALTRVCLQTRSESLGIFYGHNTFYSQVRYHHDRAKAAQRWFQRLGNDKAALVKSVQIGLPRLYFDRGRLPMDGMHRVMAVRHAYNSFDMEHILKAASRLRRRSKKSKIRIPEGVIYLPLPEVVWRQCDDLGEVWVAERGWSNDLAEVEKCWEVWSERGLRRS